VKVTVKPFHFISDALGRQHEIEVRLNNGATIYDLLSYLRKSYNLPDEILIGRSVLRLFDGEELRDMMVLINGRNIRSLDGMETKLEDEAVIALFPPGAGG